MKSKFKLIIIFITILKISVFSQSTEELNKDYFEISKNLQIFSDVYKNVNIHFVDKTNPGELMNSAIDAMLKTLDPYTNYYPESNKEEFLLMNTGEYGGIGAFISKQNDQIIISSLYEGFPAQKSGLQVGDIILSVDDNDVQDKQSSDVSNFLKGAAGTELKIKVKRYGSNEIIEKKFKREVISLPNVPYSAIMNNNTVYVALSAFTNKASDDVIKAYKKLKDSVEIKSMILDLRGNGGGLLNEAIDIVNFFVPKNIMIVETKSRNTEYNKKYYTNNNPEIPNLPLVILIDEHSASASEIVSGALQDLDRAVVIGNNSYGKGLVQQTKNMDYNTILKVTVSKYYTPSGRCIQKIDYSDRKESGEGKKIDDVATSEFKTLNGRKVLGNRGIDPDIEVKNIETSYLIVKLMIENKIFNFINKYLFENKVDVKADKYQFDDIDEFIEFMLQDTSFHYESGTMNLIKGLEEISKNEKKYEANKSLIEQLKNNSKEDIRRDIISYKNEILQLITSEIISRYSFQKGLYQYNLKNDDDINKAFEVLNDINKYNKILNK